MSNCNSSIYQEDCLIWMGTQLPNSVDFVFGSPPYAEKGERYIGGAKKWPTDEWIKWMMEVTNEAVRISRGYVIWIVNGSVKKGEYLPAVEGLIYNLYLEGNIACERPAIWHKNAPPNRRDWFGNDWEYCVAFKKIGETPYFDGKAVGTPPKYKNGGKFRQRTANGERKIGSDYPQNELTRPRDVIKLEEIEIVTTVLTTEHSCDCTDDIRDTSSGIIRKLVGGGQMGSKLAHENEAPFPESLAIHFIKACCPIGGTVLDPFVGSGTTIAAALKLDRNAIGIDCRESQIELSNKRVDEAIAKAG